MLRWKVEATEGWKFLAVSGANLAIPRLSKLTWDCIIHVEGLTATYLLAAGPSTRWHQVCSPPKDQAGTQPRQRVRSFLQRREDIKDTNSNLSSMRHELELLLAIRWPCRRTYVC